MSDSFTVNVKFSCKLTRVKVQQIVQKESAPELAVCSNIAINPPT